MGLSIYELENIAGGVSRHINREDLDPIVGRVDGCSSVTGEGCIQKTFDVPVGPDGKIRLNSNQYSYNRETGTMEFNTY